MIFGITSFVVIMTLLWFLLTSLSSPNEMFGCTKSIIKLHDWDILKEDRGHVSLGFGCGSSYTKSVNYKCKKCNKETTEFYTPNL